MCNMGKYVTSIRCSMCPKTLILVRLKVMGEGTKMWKNMLWSKTEFDKNYEKKQKIKGKK